MQFIDEVKIHVKAGDGGNGSAAFRREKYVPRGGPSGGDGGNGGSVVLLADGQLGTLLDLRYQQNYKAKPGEHGQGRDRYGRAGEDLIVRVPVGTMVKDEGGATLADLVTDGARFIAAQGGRGGRGNIHFATSTNQAPKTAEDGTPGEERTLRLELKLLADVGLLGYPNVGKSTFIARVSRARPKIADYPFTTLTPNLGVVQLKGEGRTLVVADIPGLIEGAAEGHGLGHRFLRHVERTAVLLHLVERNESPDREPLKDYDVLCRELSRYSPELAGRPQVVALAKIDLTETRDAYPELQAAFAARGVTLHALSAATGEGVPEVLEVLWKVRAAARAPAVERPAPAGKQKR